MKTFLVSKNDVYKKFLVSHFKPLGFEIIHFHKPMDALKNLDNLEPEMIIYHAGDFPRHWKPFLKILRETKTKEQAVFTLIKGSDFPFEEAAKAIGEKLNELQAVIKQYEKVG